MHTDSAPSTSDAAPPSRTAGDPVVGLGAVSDQVLEAAGVSRTAVDATDAFMAVMRRMRDHLAAVAEGLGMTPPMVLTLRMLEHPLAQRDIAAAIGCDPSYVTSIVDRLEELDAVERTADPADRRVKRIVLTDEGWRLRAAVATDLLRDMPLAAALDDEELARLHALLQRALDRTP